MTLTKRIRWHYLDYALIRAQTRQQRPRNVEYLRYIISLVDDKRYTATIRFASNRSVVALRTAGETVFAALVIAEATGRREASKRQAESWTRRMLGMSCTLSGVVKQCTVDLCMAAVPYRCFSWDGHSSHRSIAPNLHWQMSPVRGESQQGQFTSCMYF